KAIPPVLLRAHAAGKVVKALDGELDVYVGPSKFRVEANDLSIKDYKILEQLGAEFYVNDAAFTYGGDQYKGYTVGGGANLSAKILPEGTSDKVSYMKWLVAAFEDFITLNVNGDVHATVAEAYAYRPGYIKPQRKIYGCTSVSALIATKIDGESLFGYEVGTDVATRFSLESVTWDDGTAQAFTTWMNNLTLTGGFAADAYAGDYFAEVKYIIRDGAKAALGVNGNRTYVNEILKAQGAEIAEEELSYEMGMNQQGEVSCFELEDGLQIVAVVATNTEDLDITSQGASNTTEESLSAEGAEADGDVWTDQVSINSADVDADQNVILVLRPVESATVEDVKEMVQSVSVNAVPGWERVTTKELSVSENGIISIDDKAKLTVWAGKNIDDPDAESAESMEDLENVVYVSVKKDQLTAVEGKYHFGVSADRNFTVEALKTNPVTRVAGALDGEGKLQPTISNRQPNMDYTINTYYNYKDEEGNTSINLIDSQTVAAGEEPVAVELPKAGIHVPSGSYTVSMQLFGGTGASVGEDNEDRIESTLTLPINTATTFGSGEDKQEILIQYVNENDAKKPASPDYVELESSDTGNGVMNAYWIPVSDEEGIDGYRIKLYQKDDKGNYVDTEKGYTFTEEQLQDWENIDGLEKTEVLNPHSGHMEVAYKVEMAVTAFATAADETIDSLSAEGGLETDKEYKVGVCAYKRAEDNIQSVSENTVADSMINRQICGDEKMSNSEKLMTPDPFDFEIAASDGEVTKDGENGVYKYRSDAASGRALIIRDVKTASGVYLNGDDEENNGSISISYIDPETGDEEILPMSANNPFYENWDATDLGKTREYWFAVPDFDGLTQLTVRATHYRTAADAMLQAGDETVKYIALENDNIAPVVGVDATEVTTKTDGTFTITGMANSGAEIYIDRQMAGVAGDDGKFTVTGKRQPGDSEYAVICAKDEFDNESDDIVIKVNIKTEQKTDPGQQDPKPTEQKTDPGKTEPSQAAVGATLEDTASKAEYVVTSKPGETPSVAYKASTDAKAKKITVPATITKDGVTYQVTAIS
ncbi:MAG: hypothetical protein K6E84_03265, partial [Lachnospiraceae bacterium]|nr:hypothetical protein [Lachnospiraceae bacterium]